MLIAVYLEDVASPHSLVPPFQRRTALRHVENANWRVPISLVILGQRESLHIQGDVPPAHPTEAGFIFYAPDIAD